MAKNYYTTRDAARLLGVSTRTAQVWLEKGQLVGWKTPGGHRRITPKSVQLAMQKHHHARELTESGSALPVLIVEDDATLLKLYRTRIARWPFDVVIYSAPNGYEGLVMVGEMAPRLLICDLRLPGVNGFQIVRSLCEMRRYQDLRIVVVSGLSRAEISAHGGLPARVELMGKPIDFARLEYIAREVWQSMPIPIPT